MTHVILKTYQTFCIRSLILFGTSYPIKNTNWMPSTWYGSLFHIRKMSLRELYRNVSKKSELIKNTATNTNTAITMKKDMDKNMDKAMNKKNHLQSLRVSSVGISIYMTKRVLIPMRFSGIYQRSYHRYSMTWLGIGRLELHIWLGF